MLTLGERIRHLRTTLLRENQASFAKRLGFARVATISDYEMNKRTPDVETIRKIAVLGSVTLEWLLTGKGPGSGFAPQDTRNKSGISPARPPADFMEVEVYDVQATASPQGFPGTPPSGSFLIPRVDYRKGTVAVRIRGESMSPCIMDGGIVGIDRKDSRLASGGLYAVWLEREGMTIKRVFVYPDRVVLRPDNPSFPETTVPAPGLDKAQVLGRVVWLYQRL